MSSNLVAKNSAVIPVYLLFIYDVQARCNEGEWFPVYFLLTHILGHLYYFSVKSRYGG
jgi:hypothetical protein